MKYDKGQFSASGEYVARKPFDFQGEHFAYGVKFDFLRIGCSARKLRQLWDNGFIVPLGILPERALTSPDADPGDEADDQADMKADADAKAKRAEAGRKSAETRAAKKAAQEA